jgi:prepilin-type N-terminal cleavage/methylation domain-containing protein
MNYFSRNNRRGFTLIELLIAVSLFAIAVAIAAGGFVRALRTQRQLIALISANSSASLAIEQIAREIRTGSGFDCSAGVPNAFGGLTCQDLSFTNAAGEPVVYSLQADADGADDVLARTAGTGAPEALTPADTQISNLQFILFNNSAYPPRITITMGVTAKSYGLDSSVTNLQTTVSSRAL